MITLSNRFSQRSEFTLWTMSFESMGAWVDDKYWRRLESEKSPSASCPTSKKTSSQRVNQAVSARDSGPMIQPAAVDPLSSEHGLNCAAGICDSTRPVSRGCSAQSRGQYQFDGRTRRRIVSSDERHGKELMVKPWHGT